jgi:hypothetical protein
VVRVIFFVKGVIFMEMLDKVKSRKQGNSIVVTLSSKLNIDEGKEFYVYKSASGAITLLPKVEDYFESLKKEDFELSDIDNFSVDYQPQGSEWIDE